MTNQAVKDQLIRRKAMANDDEVAHIAEDNLHHDILEAIAAGKCENPRALALLGLQTRNIKFVRWSA